MLRLRGRQIAALSAVMKSRFESGMVARLRAKFPAITERRSDEEILKFVRLGVQRAAVYGVTIERDVERYVEYMIMYGPHFDVDPRYAGLARVLNAPELTGTSKMDSIDDYDQFVNRR
jgi:hypothetical protein